MELSPITEISTLRKTGAVQKLGSVAVNISQEAMKIENWVEALKSMPDIRDVGAPTTPDPKKIASAILKSGW